MKPIFADRLDAFAPFFDTPVSVERDCESVGKRVSGTFNACVFDNGFADPFVEADADTTIRTYSISIMAGDWIDRKPPQVGDRITIGLATDCAPELPSLKLAVSRIDSLVGDVWAFTAREVK